MKKRTLTFLALTAAGILALPQGAEKAVGAAEDPLEQCRVASSNELDEVRGGYVTDNGLVVSFGVEKLLQLNGVTLLTSTLNLTAGQAADPATAPAGRAAVNLLQNGAGNSVDPRLLSGLQPGTFTFIQNTLDRAVIQNTTRIDATVTVRGLYRDMNLSSLLNQQLIRNIH